MTVALIIGTVVVLRAGNALKELHDRKRHLREEIGDEGDDEGVSDEHLGEGAPDTDETENWVVLAVFPMEQRTIHPVGAQFVTRKTVRDHMYDLLTFRSSSDLPRPMVVNRVRVRYVHTVGQLVVEDIFMRDF